MRNPTRAPRDGFAPNPKAKLLDQMREVMRFHHDSYRTEKTYVHWVRRFLAFHRRPDRTGPDGLPPAPYPGITSGIRPAAERG